MHARSVKKHEETMARELKREAQNRKWKEEQLKVEQLKRQWTCDVCNLSMHSVYRDAHLISRRHTHFVRQREKKVARELKREAQIRKRREEQLEQQWTCDICDRSMDRICRDAHLFSKRHTRNVREREKAVDRGLKREAQDRTRREEQLERQWTCDVCHCTMNSDCRNAHLFGKRHARVVREREAVKA
jgi:transcription elongation factor Elf1